MDEIREKWDQTTYADMRARLHANNEEKTGGYCYITPSGKRGRCTEHVIGNRLFSDEKAFLAYSDIDGDGKMDDADRHFDFIFPRTFENLNNLAYQPTADLDTPPASKVRDTIGNLDAVFEDGPFLRSWKLVINTAQEDDYGLNRGHGKGWFWGGPSDQNPLSIVRSGRNEYRLTLNIGYAHQSKNALRMLAYPGLGATLAGKHPKEHRDAIDRMIRIEDLLPSEAGKRDQVIAKARALGLAPKEIRLALDAISKKKRKYDFEKYIGQMRGVIVAFRFLKRYHEKYSKIVELDPSNSKAAKRLEGTRELYAAAVEKYQLPQIDYETMMQIMEISTAPTGWYLAYAVKNDESWKSMENAP